MNYSDYVIFSDESGNPNPVKPDPNYPVFVRSFCIFRRDHYRNDVAPAFAKLKLTHLGTQSVILHEREIRLAEPPFDFQGNQQKRDDFMRALAQAITAADFTIIAATIDTRLESPIPNQPSAFDRLAFGRCLPRLRDFLNGHDQAGLTAPIWLEAQGKGQDDALRNELWNIQTQWHKQRWTSPSFQVNFDSKQNNTVGVQIADLTARPIGIHVLKPDQPNRAWDTLEPKLYRDSQGNPDGRGLIAVP